jgi:hypothetical protein
MKLRKIKNLFINDVIVKKRWVRIRIEMIRKRQKRDQQQVELDLRTNGRNLT